MAAVQEAPTKTSKPGLWGAIRTVRWRQPQTTGKPERGALAVAAAAGSAVLDAPAVPALERTSANPRGGGEEANGGAGARPVPRGDAAPDFGYARGLERKYRVLRELGKGGNGVVRVVEERATGQEWALKSIPKVLTDPKLSETWVLRRRQPCFAGNFAGLYGVGAWGRVSFFLQPTDSLPTAWLLALLPPLVLRTDSDGFHGRALLDRLGLPGLACHAVSAVLDVVFVTR